MTTATAAPPAVQAPADAPPPPLPTPKPYTPPTFTPPPPVPLPPPSQPGAVAAALAAASFTAPAIALLSWGACPRCVLRLAGVREAGLYEAPAPTCASLLAALKGEQAAPDAGVGVDGGPAMHVGGEVVGPCVDNGGGACAGAEDGAAGPAPTQAYDGDGRAPPPPSPPQPPACSICVGVLQALDCPTPPLPPPLMTVAAALDSGAGEWRSAASGNAASLAAAVAAEGHAGNGAATLQILYPASAAVRQACAITALKQAGLWDEGSAGGDDDDDLLAEVGAQLPPPRHHYRPARSTVDVKDALRLALVGPLGTALGRRLGGEGEPGVDLVVALQFLHPGSAGEADALAAAGAVAAGGKRGRGPRWKGPNLHGGVGGNGKKRGRDGQAAPPPAVGRVATGPFLAALATVPPSTLTAAGLAMPPTPPRGLPAHLVTRVRRAPLLVGGYYTKTERDVSQSPFFVGGSRLGRTSVEEVLEAFLLPALRADAAKFVTAGREDMDVRMLGQGRPFVLEVLNARARVDWAVDGGGGGGGGGMEGEGNPNPGPHRLTAAAATHPPDLLSSVEEAINASGTGVGAHRLSLVTRAALAAIKAGESAKEKSYRAAVTLPVPASGSMLARLNAVRGLELAQTTPARVEARRAMLVRHRTVHELWAEPAADGGGVGAPFTTATVDPARLLTVTLRTQAGLYVKEFVHGDSGRTVPDLATVAGCPPEAGPAAITALDVLAVHLDDFL